MNESKKHDHELGRSTGNEQLACLSHDVSEKDEVIGRENDKKMFEGTIFFVQAGTSPEVGTHDSNEKCLIECTQNVIPSSCKNGKWPENVDNVRFNTSAVENYCSS